MAKASDSRLDAYYGDKDPDGDPLGELSDIMGISKDNDTEGDISLDLERELFGVNDDDPVSSSDDVSSGSDDYGDAATSLESELLAVLGGLNASTSDSDETSAKTDVAMDAPVEDETPDADLAELELADLDLDELDMAADAPVEAAAEETEPPADEASDDDLEALFADVMDAPETDIALAVEEDISDTDSGHDPLTIADEVELDEAAAAMPESADNRDFDDDVELANVLAAPHPVLGDELDETSQGEDVAAEPAGAATSDDPIADAFSDLADLDVDVPSFIGTAAGTRVAMAAVDAMADDTDDVATQDAAAADTVGEADTPDIADIEPDIAADLAALDLSDLDAEPVGDMEPQFDGAAHDEAAKPLVDEDASIDDGRALAVSADEPDVEYDLPDGEEAEFAELLAKADSEMTDEDFEAAAAALDAESETYATAQDVSFDAEPEPESSAPVAATDFSGDVQPASSDAADLGEEAIDIEAELAAFDEAVRSTGNVHADDGAGHDAPLPDIDTAEVHETIAATADFDIPELADDLDPVVASGDEFEVEFAESLARYRQENAAPPDDVTDSQDEPPLDGDDAFETLFEQDLSRDIEAAAAGMAGLGLSASETGAREQSFSDDEPEFDMMDDDLDEPVGIPSAETIAQQPASGRRGFMVASAVGALAIFGVAFAVGSSFFGGDDGPAETALIKADSEPVKVKPDNPGGTTVPNQDNAVYDRVAGTTEQEPSQESLISMAEEPVELPEQEAPEVPVQPETPTQKAEDRLTPADTADDAAASEAELALISPKRVRTLIVKPDGSLVERAAPVAAQPEQAAADTLAGEALGEARTGGETEVAALAPAPEPVPLQEPEPQAEFADVAIPTPRPDIGTQASADAAAQAAEPETPAQPAPEAVAAAVPAATPNTSETAAAEEPAVPIRTVRSETIRPAAEPASQPSTATGAVPVPVERSADQPVNVVGRTGGQATQTAAAQPAPAPAPTTTPASGGYVVQIASLPSVSEAQNSFANLSSRYASLIGGRPMNIQRAEIPGKGTFYRVRVSAQDRSDANALCSRIKASGGSCFVAR